MIVKELIKQLKKMPQDLKVYWADHDHGTYETNNVLRQVKLIDKSEMTEYDNDDNGYIVGAEIGCTRRDETFKGTPEQYVCLRP